MDSSAEMVSSNLSGLIFTSGQRGSAIRESLRNFSADPEDHSSALSNRTFFEAWTNSESKDSIFLISIPNNAFLQRAQPMSPATITFTESTTGSRHDSPHLSLPCLLPPEE